MEDAQYDLDCARDMFEKERFNYVVWLSRQAVEKMLKAAYMVTLQKPTPVAHNLMAIARSFIPDSEIPEGIASDLAFLNPHYVVTRYVDAALGKPSDLFNRSFAEEALCRAERVLEWIRGKYLT